MSGDAPGLPRRVALGAALERPDLLRGLSALIDRGGVLVVPTESSYGLAADPRSAAGVAAIYRLKGREAVKPLPVVAADREQVVALGVDPALPALAHCERLWPGVVTVVLPLARPLPATAGEATVAVRIPGHDGLRRLLARLGRALTATSANRSGAPPVVDADAAERLLGRSAPRAAGEGAGAPGAAIDAVVIDGGTLPGGAPSTIVRFGGASGDRLDVLREGAVPAEVVAQRIGDF